MQLRSFCGFPCFQQDARWPRQGPADWQLAGPLVCPVGAEETPLSSVSAISRQSVVYYHKDFLLTNNLCYHLWGFYNHFQSETKLLSLPVAACLPGTILTASVSWGSRKQPDGCLELPGDVVIGTSEETTSIKLSLDGVET